VKYTGLLLPPDAAKIMWGFFFVFGLLFAFCVRLLIQKLGAEHLIDPGIQRRITGWSIDFLIVATVMAIQFLVVWKYALPIFLISILNGVLTTLVVIYLGKRLWGHNLERTAAVYGAVTGTVSCGLLLLRIADPDFKTPVAIDPGGHRNRGDECPFHRADRRLFAAGERPALVELGGWGHLARLSGRDGCRAGADSVA
jgi:ESS family glutamate:Na+ symporter